MGQLSLGLGSTPTLQGYFKANMSSTNSSRLFCSKGAIPDLINPEHVKKNKRPILLKPPESGVGFWGKKPAPFSYPK
jgi:hypothetical protein